MPTLMDRPPTPPPPPEPRSPPCQSKSAHQFPSRIRHIYSIMRELNLMKNEIHDINSTLSSLSRTQASDTALRQEVANLRLTVSGILSKKAHLPTNTGRLTNSLPQSTHQNSRNMQTSVCISAWNCWGLANAVPYLQTLAEKSDVIVLAEHWLWPFELSKLDSMHRPRI